MSNFVNKTETNAMAMPISLAETAEAELQQLMAISKRASQAVAAHLDDILAEQLAPGNFTGRDARTGHVASLAGALSKLNMTQLATAMGMARIRGGNHQHITVHHVDQRLKPLN